MTTSNHHASPQTSNRLAFILLVCLALLAVACGGSADPSATKSTGEDDSADEAVEYEPAYPEDVSTDELSESDTAQQHEPSHEGGEHEHGDESHDHHEDGDEGDHSHGDDDHSN